MRQSLFPAALSALLILPAIGCDPPAGKGASSAAASSSAVAKSPGSAAASASAVASNTAAASAEPAAKAFVAAHSVPAFTGKFPHQAHPFGDNINRKVLVSFKSKEGVPDDAISFTIKNLSDQKLGLNQTWVYYYAKGEESPERYPHSLGGHQMLEPGQSVEQRLGRNLKDIDAKFDSFEAEVVSVMIDGKPWNNENLNPMPRPKGGVSAEELAAHAGERLIVEVYDLTSYKVRVTNITDQVVERASIQLNYRDAKGGNNLVQASFPDDQKPIEPGASVDLVVKTWGDGQKSPPKATAAAGFASRVDFVGGKTFENANLAEEFEWPKSESPATE